MRHAEQLKAAVEALTPEAALTVAAVVETEVFAVLSDPLTAWLRGAVLSAGTGTAPEPLDLDNWPEAELLRGLGASFCLLESCTHGTADDLARCLLKMFIVHLTMRHTIRGTAHTRN